MAHIINVYDNNVKANTNLNKNAVSLNKNGDIIINNIIISMV